MMSKGKFSPFGFLLYAHFSSSQINKEFLISSMLGGKMIEADFSD